MNAHEILAQLQADAAAGKSLDFRAVRESIHDAFERTDSASERVVLLQAFNAVMDQVERSGSIDPENLEVFRDTRAKDYNLLLMREVVIGENASTELLHAVTAREVAAGRMTEDHALRKLAVEGIAQPYLTVQQLTAIEQQRLAALQPKPKGWRKWFGK